MFTRKVLDIGTLTAGTATGTDSVELRYYDDGDMLLYVAARTTSSYTITQQCSFDNINWYDVVDAYNATVGAVLTAADATVHSRLIQLTPIAAPYIRFEVTASETDGSIDLTLCYQEDL